MAQYQYIVKTKKGEVRQGHLEAPSKDVVEQVLDKKGFLVVEVKERKNDFQFSIPFIGGISLKDKAVFIRQLATMLDAGISMGDALEVIISQTSNKRFVEVLKDISKKVESGSSLSIALEDHTSVFRPVFSAVISSGEETGKLPTVLLELADELEIEQDFNSKLWASLAYPIFVLVVLIIAMAIMMIYVMPQLTSLFDESQMTLPWTTQLVISVSTFMAGYWWAILIILIGVGILLRYYLNTDKGKYWWSSLKFRIPIVKGLLEQAAMVRFCQMMSLLLGTGIPILKAIKLTAGSMDNLIYRDALSDAAAEVERGIPFSTPLAKSGVFPIVVPQMIKVGEQAGKVSDILDKLSKYYQKETESRIKAVSSLIEPAIVVILGLGVGFVIFSIIVPIYQISLGVL